MKKTRYLTAQEAAQTLGIKTATLYAYVSRGLIRSEAINGDSRVSRYNAEDVEKLRQHKDQRRNPAESARKALNWGTPLLESALTLITDDGLYYRGQDALELATTHTVEQVAALFWMGDTKYADSLFNPQSAQTLIAHCLDGLSRLDGNLSLIQKLQIGLALASGDDLAAFNIAPEKVAQTGARILRLLATVIAGQDLPPMPIAQLLSTGWQLDEDPAAGLLNSTLILCADHELNVSSFTARVVASAQAQPYAVVMAGLAVMAGLRHGGNVERVEALLREADQSQNVDGLIEQRLRLGEQIPGFGHRLYPDGDPRAVRLLSLFADTYPTAPDLTFANKIAKYMHDTLDLAPNIDFALAVLARLLVLPPGAAMAIFALGRSIGWLGHAIEQYEQGDLIRPRASYIGVPIAPTRNI